MLRNYLTTFVRVLLRQKIYSIINVFGLAVGIAATMIIGLYVIDELSYDRFHKDAERIYRVGVEGTFAGVENNLAPVGEPIGEAMQKEMPPIEAFTRIILRQNNPIQLDELHVNSNLILADSNFFSFFSFKLLEGDIGTVLDGPDKIVLTKKLAERIFGAEANDLHSLIGKTILCGTDRRETLITGICEDPPVNSHFHFDGAWSLETKPPKKMSFALPIHCHC